MGRSCTRRSSALRVFNSGRRTGRAELEHDFEEARELSKGTRRIPPGKDRALYQSRCAAVATQRRNRAEPVENRGYNREREKVSRGAKRIRKFRRLSLELRRRQTNSELLANVG